MIEIKKNIKMIEIKKNIKMVCDSSSYIKRCMDDNKFLCDELNNLDKNYIKGIYKSEKSGVVSYNSK